MPRAKLGREGREMASVFAELDDLLATNPPERAGRLTMYSLRGTADVQRVVAGAFERCLPLNALFRRALPALERMEQDVLDMSLELFRAGASARGSITSGGSESIFCAVHAIRGWAQSRYPHADPPEIIAPLSAHASLSKACHYLGVGLRRLPLDQDYRADVDAMARAIGSNTVAVYGSAPQWPHGRFDPIAALGQVAERHGLWFHVDACVGGYLSPFVRRLGYPVPEFDFSLPGVSSLSADLHKYGYAGKPCSAVFFAREELYAHGPLAIDDWPTGRYLTDGLVGSRPAASVASAWAVMRYLGESGYLRLADQTMRAKTALIDGLREIEGIDAWDNELSLVVFGSNTLDVRALARALVRRGWLVMGTADPPLIHLTMDPVDREFIDAYLTDVATAAAAVQRGEETDGGHLRYAD